LSQVRRANTNTAARKFDTPYTVARQNIFSYLGTQKNSRVYSIILKKFTKHVPVAVNKVNFIITDRKEVDTEKH
jgi:hypothetical protein